ncbi:cytochrome c heme lyase subunit CcmF [Klebsiella pneumoniae]|uniref:Cytochrome c heme lyase subunit CcmF n=1 Tax=Klebsiella pneumoniae TaxID=573 RepID=A0A378A3U4_KLEPN|nr:cytochrome c heme lyase subunit CcmF [Klebsiella pneumoniae]
MYGCAPATASISTAITFVFNGVRNIVGPNWTGGEGIIAVTRNGRPEATLYARSAFTPPAG